MIPYVNLLKEMRGGKMKKFNNDKGEVIASGKIDRLYFKGKPIDIKCIGGNSPRDISDTIRDKINLGQEFELILREITKGE